MKVKYLNLLRDIFIILIITFILIEIIFRIIPKSIFPNLGPNKINVEFKEFGPWFASNQSVSFTDSCSYVYPITTNQFGMRDKQRNIKKGNKLRIAVLGDSIMEGLHVEDYKYATILIEEELNKNDIDSEVLNFSFSGYGTSQQLALFENLVYKFNPDVVLLFSLASNDLRNNSRDLEYLAYGNRLEDYGSSNSPPFSYYEFINGELVYFPNLRKENKIKKFLKKYIFYKFYSLDYIKNILLKFKRLRLIDKIEKIDKNLDFDEENSNVAKNNYENLKNKSILNTFHIVKKLKKITKEQNAILYQVIYNDHPDNSKIFENIAIMNKIKFLNFGPKDNNLYEEYLIKNKIKISETHPTCDAHPNKLGHKIIADITSEWLITLLK